VWNPETDAAIATRYSAADLEGKAACREALRRELGLDDGPGLVIGMVTRLVGQKGLDLVLEALPELVEAGFALALTLFRRRLAR